MVPFRHAMLRVVAVLSFLLSSNGCDTTVQLHDSHSESLKLDSVSPQRFADKPTSEVAIATFCGDCHVFPPPTSFPKDRWRHEVEQGFQIYRDSQRRDLVPPDLETTVSWFESLAPDAYEFPKSTFAVDKETNSRFKLVESKLSSVSALCSIAHLNPNVGGEVLACDLDTGLAGKLRLEKKSFAFERLGKVADPVHIESADLDNDGVTDYVVADIGSIRPNDQRYGSLWWIRPNPDSTKLDDEKWTTELLKTGYSRVCDARPCDYDNDGDQDLVVAEFGFRFEGSIELLRNVGSHKGVPQFEAQVIDSRNGAIHVPVVDLDGDGRLDFVTLVSQEHETIDVHLNLGNDKFEIKRIYRAPDPAYASSGIEVVDMDGDDDLDILYTNGDTFDDDIAKPFHSIQWLENEGTYPFTHHHLAYMPGVYRAVAGDIDQDGDMDIAAVALVSQANNDQSNLLKVQTGQDTSMNRDGVVWLEQTSPGQFSGHRLLADVCEWATCALVDLDNDSDLDLVVGRYHQRLACPDSIIFFENQTAADFPEGAVLE